jgi:solute carrier family 13 (sodium-dependent dicarboxylate transporter), member 2/3/5
MPFEISAAEARFEAWRQCAGFILAPIIFITLLFWPLPNLTPAAHKLAAVMGLVMCLWITEALPLAVTGLLGPTLVILLGIAPAAKAFAPFADPIMFLFVGAFVLARAINLHGLDRRFAYAVLSHRWVGESTSRILFAYGAVTCTVSMWISNTATVAMMFPIGLAIVNTMRRLHPEAVSSKYASAMMLMCAFSGSIGGLATPVGTPTNLIGLGFIEKQLGRQVHFLEWMSFALPIVVVLYLLLFSYLNFLCPGGIKRLVGVREALVAERGKLGKLSTGEWNTLSAWHVTVALWIAPGILAMIYGESSPITKGFSKYVPESVAALLGTFLLFLLPTNWKKREFTITLKSALEIDWAVLALYGGGIALGQMVFATKLADTLGKGMADWIPATSYGIIAIAAIVATLTSELTSNVASVNMVVPLVIAMAGSTGLPAALAASMAATLGFMLPISTPTNAIVYSSGMIPLPRMIKYGVLLDVIGFAVILLGTLLLVPTQ